MTATPVAVSPDWLALREPADAAARAADLVEVLRPWLAGDELTIIHDLGCGTGSMGRWLAPQLAGPQHWLLYDRDPELLARAAENAPDSSADGAPVTVETRQRDITRLSRDELAGASLITASALLDMLTADEVGRIAASCIAAGCPALLTLSVVGVVEMTPADPLDRTIAEAFNLHQRRTSGDRRLLGPDAVDAAIDMFGRLGGDVHVRPSPWRLDAATAALAAEWLTGWVDAACEQRLELTEAALDYRERRLATAAAGQLAVTLHHLDILVRPR